MTRIIKISRLFYFLSSHRRGDQSTVFCMVSFDFNWSRSAKIRHPYALVCCCGLAIFWGLSASADSGYHKNLIIVLLYIERKKWKSCFFFFTDKKQHKARELDRLPVTLGAVVTSRALISKVHCTLSANQKRVRELNNYYWIRCKFIVAWWFRGELKEPSAIQATLREIYARRAIFLPPPGGL